MRWVTVHSAWEVFFLEKVGLARFKCLGLIFFWILGQNSANLDVYKPHDENLSLPITPNLI